MAVRDGKPNLIDHRNGGGSMPEAREHAKATHVPQERDENGNSRAEQMIGSGAAKLAAEKES